VNKEHTKKMQGSHCAMRVQLARLVLLEMCSGSQSTTVMCAWLGSLQTKKD
jgi:hypothetical protein